MNTEYNPWSIEARWRNHWAATHIYRTPEPQEGQATYYCLDFFPYPSGAGLSVGHGRNYVPSDVLARYHRMRGAAVLHPMGWDAFGLPAENEAIKTGAHPAESTARYASNYRHQLDLLGCSYDWEREVSSSDPAYYRWNQAFFLLLYRRGLAYRAEALVNWCESCQTVLAAEEIEDGVCWRCHKPVVQRTRKQWYIRVTAYAEELCNELENLDWPEHILAMQRHWIGRSDGVEVVFTVADNSRSAIQNPKSKIQNTITVFTTRPDTWFGVTFIALAPEHPLAGVIAAPEQHAAVHKYIRQAGQRSSIERHTRTPDGVFTGVYASAPGLPSAIPIYVADYVLAEHGTGAIMGVPAHDSRDFAFARACGLPVKPVIAAPDGTVPTLPYTDPGVMTNSAPFDGMPSQAAEEAMAEWMEREKFGKRTRHYRLRDWLISRQRYWGTPIPIVHCPDCGEVPVPEDDLPVQLPSLPDFRPRGDGKAPLANVPDFVQTPCPHCGKPAMRETDTMTGFVCSSWYYMRFTDPHNAARPFDPDKVARWMPVNVYIGGAEHAVGHLLYSRFWSKVLADAGMVTFREPFPTLRSQGVLHARDAESGKAERMSKSKGNIVTPESVVARYGADVTRLHLMFMGPFEANVVWETEADGETPQHIEGVRRFLQRTWRLIGDTNPAETNAMPAAASSLEAETHRTIREVTEQLEVMHFNKAISALMSFVGSLENHQRQHGTTQACVLAGETLLKLLAPFAPFIAEEIWQRWGHTDSVHTQPWPAWDATLAADAVVEIAVQINGKVRDRISVARDADEATVRQTALDAAGVKRTLEGRAPRQVIVVPGRVVNIVV
ncbi:MAG: leucine--tRNA ligase [Anaerolineae bacterium]|nr:leucine--tRNA ligase [Anaerolineae bacterium]